MCPRQQQKPVMTKVETLLRRHHISVWTAMQGPLGIITEEQSVSEPNAVRKA